MAPLLPDPESLSPYEYGAPAGEDRLNDVLLAARDLGGHTAEHLVLSRCVLERVAAPRADFSRIQMTDARVVDCDLANGTWTGATISRVEFVRCRLTGLDWSESCFEDVLFRECTGRLAQFYGSEFRAARFENCDLQEACFQECDLRGAAFHECTLARADLSGAVLKETDFRTSTLDGLVVSSPAGVRGAVVDLFQAAYLAGLDSLLGLSVRTD